MKRVLLLLALVPLFLSSQQKNSPLIDSLLRSRPELFSRIISLPKKYRIQIIFTQVNRDKKNNPEFIQHNYFLDSTNYFYCASLVKLPCSILALQKLNELKVEGLTPECKMVTDSVNPCQKKVTSDTSAPGGNPSVGHYIKKMLLVSDNHAYGRIYEFLTPDYIHRELSLHGYSTARIVHRFDGGCTGPNNLLCNPVTFFDKSGKMIWAQESRAAELKFDQQPWPINIGKAHISSSGKKINEPKDFSGYNFMHLQQVNDLLKWLIFMPWAPAGKKFNITAKDRNFLLCNLAKYPRESDFPKYNPSNYYDSYKKYFIYGDSKKEIKDPDIRIFNIVGQSYGFMVDCAYIVNFKTRSEFMLSAVIYANEDEVINDGKYEYRTVALPYLGNLGKLFLEYESSRKKETLPDLDEFKPAFLSSR